MSVTVICPLYNAKDYILNLHESLVCQEDVDLVEIKYILTDTNDGIDTIIESLPKANLTKVSLKEFSHSLVREKAALESESDIIVFITQDIKIIDKKWLYKLCKPIYEKRCAAAFSRQICDNKSIERYTRMNNYPEESRIVSKEDISRYKINTFFFSDAASAIKKSIYVTLNGYDKKDLLTNEDMYIAYKLIMNGYKIMYNAEAIVIHSHDYKFSQLFKRYFDQGVFLKDNNYLLEYGANESALKLLKFVTISSLKEGNYKTFFKIVPNFAARFLGNKFGQNYDKLSMSKIQKYSSNKNYWERNKNN